MTPFNSFRGFVLPLLLMLCALLPGSAAAITLPEVLTVQSIINVLASQPIVVRPGDDWFGAVQHSGDEPATVNQQFLYDTFDTVAFVIQGGALSLTGLAEGRPAEGADPANNGRFGPGLYELSIDGSPVQIQAVGNAVRIRVTDTVFAGTVAVPTTPLGTEFGVNWTKMGDFALELLLFADGRASFHGWLYSPESFGPRIDLHHENGAWSRPGAEVPEPMTALLLGAGLTGVAARRRLRW